MSEQPKPACVGRVAAPREEVLSARHAFYAVEAHHLAAYVYRFWDDPCNDQRNRELWVDVGRQQGLDRAPLQADDPLVETAYDAGFVDDVAHVALADERGCLPPTLIMPLSDPPLRAYHQVYAGAYAALYTHDRNEGQILLQLERLDGTYQWWLVSFRQPAVKEMGREPVHAEAEKP